MNLTEILNIKNNFKAFYDTAIIDMAVNQEFLTDSDIRNYILNKITAKAINYPEHLSFFWKTEKDFYKFENALKGEIFKHFLNLKEAANHENRNADKDLKAAVSAYKELNGTYTLSLQDKAKGDSDYDELISFIPSKDKTPLEILLESENPQYEEEEPVYNAEEENEILNINIRTAYHTQNNTARAEQLSLF